MKLEDLRSHFDARFDRLETKVDDHLERLSKAEEAIVWMRGHLKLSTTIFITVATAAIMAALKLKGI